MICSHVHRFVLQILLFLDKVLQKKFWVQVYLAAYFMFGTVACILMALFIDTMGGTQDNAKKYIDLVNFGVKNSEARKYFITDNTVADPFVSSVIFSILNFQFNIFISRKYFDSLDLSSSVI